MRRATMLAAAAAWLALSGAAPAADWDELGAEFCARTATGNLAAVAPLLSPSLLRTIVATYQTLGSEPPPTLFQSYTNVVPVCAARTRNVALIEITRSGPGGAAPAWTEYLVVAPEADGSTRIDDVLFATRRSDTLRARLNALAN